MIMADSSPQDEVLGGGLQMGLGAGDLPLQDNLDGLSQQLATGTGSGLGSDMAKQHDGQQDDQDEVRSCAPGCPQPLHQTPFAMPSMMGGSFQMPPMQGNQPGMVVTGMPLSDFAQQWQLHQQQATLWWWWQMWMSSMCGGMAPYGACPQNMPEMMQQAMTAQQQQYMQQYMQQMAAMQGMTMMGASMPMTPAGGMMTMEQMGMAPMMPMMAMPGMPVAMDAMGATANSMPPASATTQVPSSSAMVNMTQNPCLPAVGATTATGLAVGSTHAHHSAPKEGKAERSSTKASKRTLSANDATTTPSGGNLASTPAKRGRRATKEQKICKNCGTKNTPFWRKDKHDGKPLCNACGLYFSKNEAPRPKILWKQDEDGNMIPITVSGSTYMQQNSYDYMSSMAKSDGADSGKGGGAIKNGKSKSTTNVGGANVAPSVGLQAAGSTTLSGNGRPSPMMVPAATMMMSSPGMPAMPAGMLGPGLVGGMAVPGMAMPGMPTMAPLGNMAPGMGMYPAGGHPLPYMAMAQAVPAGQGSQSQPVGMVMQCGVQAGIVQLGQPAPSQPQGQPVSAATGNTPQGQAAQPHQRYNEGLAAQEEVHRSDMKPVLSDGEEPFVEIDDEFKKLMEAQANHTGLKTEPSLNCTSGPASGVGPNPGGDGHPQAVQGSSLQHPAVGGIPVNFNEVLLRGYHESIRGAVLPDDMSQPASLPLAGVQMPPPSGPKVQPRVLDTHGVMEPVAKPVVASNPVAPGMPSVPCLPLTGAPSTALPSHPSLPPSSCAAPQAAAIIQQEGPAATLALDPAFSTSELPNFLVASPPLVKEEPPTTPAQLVDCSTGLVTGVSGSAQVLSMPQSLNAAVGAPGLHAALTAPHDVGQVNPRCIPGALTSGPVSEKPVTEQTHMSAALMNLERAPGVGPSRYSDGDTAEGVPVAMGTAVSGAHRAGLNGMANGTGALIPPSTVAS